MDYCPHAKFVHKIKPNRETNASYCFAETILIYLHPPAFILDGSLLAEGKNFLWTIFLSHVARKPLLLFIAVQGKDGLL